MVDPLLALGVLSLSLAASPGPGPGTSAAGAARGAGAGASASADPGPSPVCPPDMRLVTGTHYEMVAHLCTDPQPPKTGIHCYRYLDGLSVIEGPGTAIHVCMDQYEAPNRRGAKPLVMQSYRSAERYCRARGKRPCTEQEWELACEGPQHLPLAYGWSVNVKMCNSAKAWIAVDFEAFDQDQESAQRESARLWQGAPSGRYPTCTSPFGIVDMMGNVEEWVSSRSTRKWPGALMGGFWAKAWTGCRGTNDAHQPTFAFYETGFRCCKDPKPVLGLALGWKSP